MKRIVLLAALFTALFALAVFAQTPDVLTPDISLAPPDDWSFGQIMALIGAVIVLARVVVKLTPTPKDDTILASIVEFL